MVIAILRYHSLWRWELRFPNGMPLLQSARGYKHRRDALNSIRSFNRKLTTPARVEFIRDAARYGTNI